MNIQEVKDFIEWAEGFPFVEVHDTEKWQIIGDDSVYWSSTDFREDEWEYSSDVHGSVLRKEGFVLVNTDNGGVETVTLVFLESNEVK